MEPSKGYQPPHRRSQRGSNSNNSNNNNNNNNRGPTKGGRGGVLDPSMSVSSEDLERRRNRFAKEAVEKKEQMGYGLVSRGEDNRLQRDPEARRVLFQEITKQFIEAFSNEEDVASLQGSLERISLNDQSETRGHVTVDTVDEAKDQDKLSEVLMSLRKLREALLNSSPDEFSKSVFLFSIRTAARVGHYQTYVPSINYLLKHSTILSKSELHEVSYLYALHLSHFNKDHTKALEVMLRYCPDDLHLHQVLLSFRNLEYVKWLGLYHREKDVPRYRIMRFGESMMVQHAINCIEKSYFQLPLSYVKQTFSMGVPELREKHNCTWRLDVSTVVVRERR